MEEELDSSQQFIQKRMSLNNMKKFNVNLISYLVILLFLFLVSCKNMNLKKESNANNILQEFQPDSIDEDFEFEADMSAQNHSGSIVKDERTEIGKFRKAIANFTITVPESIYLEYYNKIGPIAMLNVIEENKYCHSIGHSLGRVIYNKTQNLGISMEICKNRCSSGCFHGVLMGLLTEIVPSEMISQNSLDSEHIVLQNQNASKFFENFCSKSEISKFIKIGNCYHAIGHGVLFASNYNLTRALEYCRSMDEKIGRAHV